MVRKRKLTALKQLDDGADVEPNITGMAISEYTYKLVPTDATRVHIFYPLMKLLKVRLYYET